MLYILPFLFLLSHFQLEAFIFQLDHCAMSSVDFDHSTGGLPELKLELEPVIKIYYTKSQQRETHKGKKHVHKVRGSQELPGVQSHQIHSQSLWQNM